MADYKLIFKELLVSVQMYKQLLESSMDELLEKLGLGSEEIIVFREILKLGHTKASPLAKKLDIPRTSIYRYLDALVEIGLVSRLETHGSTQYIGSSPQVLENLVKEKEVELKQMKSNMLEAQSEIYNLQNDVEERSSVRVHKGERGIKQVSWNSTKAKGILRIIEIDSMNILFDVSFAEKIREEMGRNNIEVRQLTNLKKITLDSVFSDHIKNTHVRFIDKQKLDIQYEILIYNNIFAIYNLDKNSDIVEIQSQALAQMQSDIFDSLWNDSKEMERVDNKGTWELI